MPIQLDPNIIAQVKGKSAPPPSTFQLDPDIIAQVKSENNAQTQTTEPQGLSFSSPNELRDYYRNLEAQKIGANAPSEPTSFGAQVMESFGDTPQAKINALAKSRFPNLPLDQAAKRYGVINGNIVYRGDDGKIYHEDEPGFVASTLGYSPNIIGGTIGAILGAPGGIVGSTLAAGAGSAGGELVRKAIAAKYLNQQQPASDIGLSALGQGALGVLGGAAGKIIAEPIANAVFNKIANGVAKPVAGISTPEALATRDAAKNLGIDNLSQAEATGNKSDIQIEKILRNAPGSAEKFEPQNQAREQQIPNAVYQALDTIAPSEGVPNASNAVRQASQSAIKNVKKARVDEATPIYNQALQQNLPDEQFAMVAKDPFLSDVINGVKNDKLYQTEIANLPDNNYKVLDLAKQRIDDQIEEARGARQDNRVRLLTSAKNRLTSLMDQNSKDYQDARINYQSNSPQVNQLENGIVGKIANLDDTQLKNVANTLFDPAQSDPRVLEQARDVISKENPDAWNAIVRSHLQNVFEGLNQGLSGNPNTVARSFYKKTMGSPKQYQMLQTALKDNPEALQNIQYISQVFPKLGIANAEGSPTAIRQAVMEKIPSGLKDAVDFVTEPRKTITSKLTDKLFSGKHEAMAEAMINPKYADQMAAIRKMNPNSVKAITALTNLVSQISADNALQNNTYSPDQSINQ